MHLKIRHEIRCRFDAPARNLVAVLRLSPRSHEGQHVSDWWIDSDMDCSLKSGNDEFGNLTNTFSAVGPVSAIAFAATGLVDTFDMAGVTRGTAERMPLDVFLRDTSLTTVDTALRAFAGEIGVAEVESLGRLHLLMHRLSTEIAHDPLASQQSAADAFNAKSSNASGYAHIFIGTARQLGIPSRFVSGYLVKDGEGRPACHAWAESFVPGLGWVGFDPVYDLCPQGEHVRVAAGFDALGSAFVRGPRNEQMSHTLKIIAAG